MKYRVLRDCHFVNRYWEEGEIAEFPDDVDPNSHFEIVDGPIDPKVIPIPVPSTMSEINELNKRTQPKTGMAYKPPEEPKEETKEEDTYEQRFGRKKPGPKPKS